MTFMINTDNPVDSCERELGRALEKVESEIRTGLRHGFFELSVSSEIIKGGKRRLTIRAGKSHQFIIAEEQLRAAS